MMDLSILQVSVILCTLCVSCTHAPSKAADDSNLLTGSETSGQGKDRQREQVFHLTAALRKDASSSWRVDEMRRADQDSLRSVLFIDELHGWVGAKGILYRTTDGGKTWTPVDIPVSKAAYVTKLVFTTPTEGWAIAQQEASDPLTYRDNHFWLLRTIDGGSNWTAQLDFQDSVVRQFRLANTREGWFIGIKYTGSKPLRGQDFVFHTLDGGDHWLDVSEHLNQILAVLPIKLGFTDILPDGPLTASVVTSEGNIFKTKDGGSTWQTVNGTIDDFSYVCFCQIGMVDTKQIWLGGSKDNYRSLLGTVALKEADSWKEYLLPGVSFTDIVFLSRDEILTCGSTTPNQQGNTEKREAVISLSSDGGMSWSFVYHNPKVTRINALAAVDSGHIWAVGDGVILRLTATTKKG